MKIISVAVLVVVVAVLSGCGSGSSEPAPTVTVTRTVIAGAQAAPTEEPSSQETGEGSNPTAPQIGQTQSVSLHDGSAIKITVSDLKRAKPSEFGSPKGNLFTVQVAIEGTAGSYDANPLSFSARSADGDDYEAGLGDVDGQLAATSVRPGQKLRGLIPFDVPKGQKISLVILGDPLGAELLEWAAAEQKQATNRDISPLTPRNPRALGTRHRSRPTSQRRRVGRVIAPQLTG